MMRARARVVHDADGRTQRELQLARSMTQRVADGEPPSLNVLVFWCFGGWFRELSGARETRVTQQPPRPPKPPRQPDEPNEDSDRLAREAIGAALDVHRTLGPGLLEPVKKFYAERAGIEAVHLKRNAHERRYVRAAGNLKRRRPETRSK
jgi:hypothetical protein